MLWSCAGLCNSVWWLMLDKNWECCCQCVRIGVWGQIVIMYQIIHSADVPTWHAHEHCDNEAWAAHKLFFVQMQPSWCDYRHWDCLQTRFFNMVNSKDEMCLLPCHTCVQMIQAKYAMWSHRSGVYKLTLVLLYSCLQAYSTCRCPQKRNAVSCMLVCKYWVAMFDELTSAAASRKPWL